MKKLLTMLLVTLASLLPWQANAYLTIDIYGRIVNIAPWEVYATWNSPPFPF